MEKMPDPFTLAKPFNIKDGSSYQHKQQKWAEKVSPEVRKALYNSGYNLFPPTEMVPPSRKKE
jgi:hypothetical protein